MIYTSKELKDFMDNKQASKYTFKVTDSRKWKDITMGDIYISFGKPVRVQPDNNRKILAYKTRESCLDLVTIQPINILIIIF